MTSGWRYATSNASRPETSSSASGSKPQSDGPVGAWIAPIESVSNSEAGFELVYQGSAILLFRPIALAPGERISLRVDQRVTVRADVSAPEAAARP